MSHSFRSVCFSLFDVFIIFQLLISVHTDIRTRKASRSALDEIRLLINVQAQREFVQSDAIEVGRFDEIRRNPEAKRNHDELSVNDPDEFFQGDVDLAEWQAERIQRQLLDGLKERSSEKRRARRKIGRTRQRIREALAVWQSNTCLRFQERGPDVDRLEFFDGGGCSSFVGRTGGTQGISISTPGCDYVGIIAHEVGHALGTFHEQARPDQQRNIAVHYNNIPVSRWNNFQPIGDNQAATFGLPYDAGSVMHYGAYGFAADEYRPTISTLDQQLQSTIGQRSGPSFLDIQAINWAYNCAEHCQTTASTITCTHGGYQDPNDCSSCNCPTGLSGRFCDLVEPSACGDTIELSTTPLFIASPNFPNRFPANQNCFWLLRAPKEGHVFLEFIDQFYYSCEDTCDKSYVELKPGTDFRVTGYRFCCSILPSQTFRSATNEMLVMHIAQGPISSGFKAKIWADKDFPSALTSILTTTGPIHTTEKTSNPSQGLDTTLTTSTNPPTIVQTFSPSNSEPPETTLLTIPTFVPLTFTPLPMSTFITVTQQTLPPPLTLPTLLPPPQNDCTCSAWTEWTDCSQMCGGCGKRARRRDCVAPTPVMSCQTEEKRICNLESCPEGTNFLFNNAEFHLLWKGCCVGLFKSENGTACGPLETTENPFLRIISSLLNARDAGNNNGTIAEVPPELTKERQRLRTLANRRTGEH